MAITPKTSSKKSSSSSSPDKKTKSSQSKRHSSSSSSTGGGGGNNNNSGGNTAAGEYLLERLRVLLQRLQHAAEILRDWPETQGDSGGAHADAAARLIASIRKIVLGVRSVERHVNGTGSDAKAAVRQGGRGHQGGEGGGSNISGEALQAFRTSLEDMCPIPLDLLDLLDVGQQPFGMNPQGYARGLMKESMRQLAGLERRKRSLAMLAQSIEIGMEEDDARRRSRNEGGGSGATDVRATERVEADGDGSCSNKRKRDGLPEEAAESVNKIQRTD